MLSLDVIHRDGERVVFQFGDLYPGSLFQLLKKKIAERKSVDYASIWYRLVVSLQRALEANDEHLIFVSPLHPTSSSHSSIDEELMELRQANETNRILMEGEAKGRAYLCFGVTDVRYLEDLIYRYYDSGMKIFLQNEILTRERIASALSSIKFEEGDFSSRIFSVVIGIGFFSGKEFYVTAKSENEYLVKEVLEKCKDDIE